MKQFSSFLKYRNGALYMEHINLQTIIEQVGTPAYVYSEYAMLSALQSLKKGLAGLDYLICFSVKSNSNIAVLQLLSKAGAGMDIVSGGELYRTQKAAVTPGKIIFSGVGKTKEEMKMGLTLNNTGIYSFNVESLAELILLNEIAGELGVKAPVGLRFNPDVDPKTHPYISTGIKKNKFGMEQKEILALLTQLPHLPHISLKGISIHIGSQLLSLSPLKAAFTKLAALLALTEERLSAPLAFVDVGGGLGICYHKEKIVKTTEYCQLVQRFFGKKSAFKGRLKVILEPGRFISGNAGILLTEVLYRKKKRTHDFLIVDAGMNDFIRPALYAGYHGIVPLQANLQKGKKRSMQVVGPVCESADFFGKNRLLSTQLQAGDPLAILSTGAYGFAMASHYNSRPRPPEVLVQNNSYRIIRKRETMEDLVRGE